ncbi:hypothetical protein F7Q99_27095 [Streptomyces kaniharaensis]|uniref:Uncharacterized protein n=1 Tax=Streptomyces kaniharaensis TaxID=212423 RepID=A0A6N7KYG4_9ACTN|nr:hypothetical protein [Streptomyces kaniharaensis]MQS15835.1 hypothetical protein [Streptomyces kaniharaensis]
MPINDAVPAPPPHGSLPPCPRCALTDQVRSVPAVHLSERRNVTVRASGHDGRTETREEVSALGRALAPAPPTTSTAVQALVVLGLVTLVGAVFTFIQGAMARDAPVHQKPDLSPPDWVTKHPGFPNDFPTDLPGVFPKAAPASPATHAAGPLASANDALLPLWGSYLILAVAIALLAGATALFLSRRRRLEGRPQAERLWNQAWYCARCGTAHFPPTAGQGTEALGLAEFRKAVWTAGGYGDLAERYRP